jgi:putative transposase
VPSTVEERRRLVDEGHPQLSITRQCSLLGLARSSWYFEPATESAENLYLMRLLDEQYTGTPFYGVERMTAWLRKDQGFTVNPKRVRRLLRTMGLEAIYAKPRLSERAPGHKVYPYLLRGVPIQRVDQVWSTDITYLRMKEGFMYLTAVIDWFSRYVLSWELSNTMETEFCLSVLERALSRGRRPAVFNTDQGSQYTAEAFTGRLEREGIAISMDGRGRALDNVFVERLWRTVKYEEVYLKDYTTVRDARESLASFLRFYNEKRRHEALRYETPAAVYHSQAA